MLLSFSPGIYSPCDLGADIDIYIYILLLHLNISPGKKVELQAQKCSLLRYERSPRRIYQKLQREHVKYVGARVKCCLCWPAPVQGMWEGLREGGRAAGRDGHMSPGFAVASAPAGLGTGSGHRGFCAPQGCSGALTWER